MRLQAVRYLIFASLLASVLAAPSPAQASASDPVYLSWVIHVDPSPYDTLPGWTNGRLVLGQMGTVIEAHGGTMLVGTSWNFLRGCLMFGNGPAFPGSVGDLAARGHEIAYHDHGGVSLQVATQVISNLTAPYTSAGYPTHLEGSGDFATLAALGYKTTGSLCGKDIPSQLAGSFQNPVRRVESSCYGQNPVGPIVGLGGGTADGSGRASDNTDEMTAAIQHAIARHTPGRLSFVNQGVVHPDSWINASPAQIAADMQTLDAWLTADIDPLVASGTVVWADAATKLQLFEAWETAGGSNAALFPSPNVTDPSWSFFDDTNAPLSTDRVDEVFVDSQDRLWVGGGGDGVGGLHLLDGGTWTTWDPTNSALRSHRITSIAEGPPGVMWVTTGNDSVPGPTGTALYRFDGTAWTVFDNSNAFGNENFLFDVAVDPAGVVWVGGKQALHRYDGTTWTRYGQVSPAIPPHTGIFCVTPESATALWLGLRNGGVTRLDHQGVANAATHTSVTHDRASTGGVLPADTTYTIALHPSGDVYAGTRRGLAVLSGTTWTTYQSTGSELGYDQIIDSAVDPVGDVWLATYGRGLSRFRPSLQRFHVDDIPDGTAHARMMTSVAVSSTGTVYASSLIAGGVSVYSPPPLAVFGRPDIGTTIGFTLLNPGDAGLPYGFAGAFSTTAGIPLPSPDPRVFPLDPDLLFQASISGTVPAFQDFLGVLDGAGSARPSLMIPNQPALAGLPLFFAGATADPGAPSGIRTIYGPVGITIQLVESAEFSLGTGERPVPYHESVTMNRGNPMIRSSLHAVIIALVITVLAPAQGDAVPLFDGKTLDGWTQRNGTATYRVEDGAIVGQTTSGSPNAFLCTNRDYSDFELTFEVKVHNRLNSGVQIRSRTRGGPNGRVNGPQIEIEASGKNGAQAGYIYGEAAGGWMTPGPKRIAHKHFKDGEWNAYRVIAAGANIKVWINGTQISDLTHEKRYASHPRGFIGLQVHGVGRRAGPFEVRWRKIAIREIRDTNAGWQKLYNGKDLSGWRTTGNWLPQEDGSLIIRPRPGEKGWQRYGAYLWSEKKYGDFILDLEYSYPPRGNSGVFFRVGDLANPVKTGIEAQILDCTGKKGAMTAHDHGGIISTVGASRNMSRPPNTWNRMIVTCRGHHLEVDLNGQRIVDIMLDRTPVKDRPPKGHVGLQDHGEPNELRFRNIWLKEL